MKLNFLDFYVTGLAYSFPGRNRTNIEYFTLNILYTLAIVVHFLRTLKFPISAWTFAVYEILRYASNYYRFNIRSILTLCDKNMERKGLILWNRRRMLPAFPSTRAPAPAASSPHRRRSDFSRTRAPAWATDWGWRPSLFSLASWMAAEESLVCRGLEHAQETHELVSVAIPRLTGILFSFLF